MTPAQARVRAEELRAHANALDRAAATAEAENRDLQESDLDPLFARLDAALADLATALQSKTGD